MKKTFFRCQFRYTLRRNFTDEDIAVLDFRTDADDSAIVEVFQGIITDVRNITCDFFRSEFRITRLTFVFFDVDRCVDVVFDKTLTHDDSILIVVTIPCHETDEYVATKRKFPTVHRWTICKDLAFIDWVACFDDWFLVITRSLVRTDEFLNLVTVEFTFNDVAIDFRRTTDKDFTRRDTLSDPCVLRNDSGS